MDVFEVLNPNMNSPNSVAHNGLGWYNKQYNSDIISECLKSGDCHQLNAEKVILEALCRDS